MIDKYLNQTHICIKCAKDVDKQNKMRKIAGEFNIEGMKAIDADNAIVRKFREEGLIR